MRYVATISGRKYTIDLEDNGHVRRVSVDGREMRLDWQPIAADRDAATGHYSLLTSGKSYDVFARAVEDPDHSGESLARTIEIHLSGFPYVVTVHDERTEALASLAGGAHISGDATIRAPMPGLVTNILVSAGEEIKRGQTVIVLEAMKMENDLTTPRAGIVKEIRVARGQTVAQNDALAIIGDPTGTVAPDDTDE